MSKECLPWYKRTGTRAGRVQSVSSQETNTDQRCHPCRITSKNSEEEPNKPTEMECAKGVCRGTGGQTHVCWLRLINFFIRKTY